LALRRKQKQLRPLQIIGKKSFEAKESESEIHIAAEGTGTFVKGARQNFKHRHFNLKRGARLA